MSGALPEVPSSQRESCAETFLATWAPGRFPEERLGGIAGYVKMSRCQDVRQVVR